jgi:DNA-binding MurR/RpiR family transcriptional regulator
MDGETGLLVRLRGQRDELGTALGRIADFVLAEPSAAARLTITELAEQTGTSPGTVTRFCRACGLRGFAELRVAIAEEVGRSGARRWETDIGSEIAPDDPAGQVLKVLMATNANAMMRTAEALDLAAVDEVVDRLAKARQCHFFGVGTSGVTADELRHRLRRLAVPCWSSADVHSGLTLAALADERDLFIGISTSGRVAETIEVLQAAGDNGALTVALTADPDSPLARLADLVLTTARHIRTDRADALADRHAQFLVVDLLYARLAQRSHDRTINLLNTTATALNHHRIPPTASR